jgi:hypothetical protein
MGWHARQLNIQYILLWATLASGAAQPAPATQPVAHTPPGAWRGTAEGKSDGNPFVVDGSPRWRVDQFWGADWSVPESYAPLVWKDGIGGLAWRPGDAGREFGGQPRVVVNGPHVMLSARTEWEGHDGEKIPALVFIAPADGTYAAQALAIARFFEGAGPVELMLLKHEKAARQIKRLWVAQLQNGDTEPTTIAEVRAELKAGDEILFVPRFPHLTNACDIEMTQVAVWQDAVDVAAPSTQPVAH